VAGSVEAATLHPLHAAGIETLVQIDLAPAGAELPGRTVAATEVVTALRERSLALQLDRMRETVAENEHGDLEIVASGTVLSAGLSVGYVLWLARGGVLLASLMSALPAWAMVDPMPVLAQMKRGDDDEADGDGEHDDDPIEKLFSKARALVQRAEVTPLPGLAPQRPRWPRWRP
jgi:hypothetical protein